MAVCEPRCLQRHAAQLAALDLVISVDNATLHLAGAVGTPVWALLPHAAEWRWGEATQGLWYSQLELFRQSEAGVWVGPMKAIYLALTDLFHTARNR